MSDDHGSVTELPLRPLKAAAGCPCRLPSHNLPSARGRSTYVCMPSGYHLPDGTGQTLPDLGPEPDSPPAGTQDHVPRPCQKQPTATGNHEHSGDIHTTPGLPTRSSE